MPLAHWPPRPVRLRPRRRCHQRRRRLPWWRLAGLAWALALVVALTTPPSPAGAQARAPGYVPPVDAPVVDAFRPPSGPYGPGNRGLEYDTRPGDAVRASADGAVVFAGRVGGSLHVTLRHADGVRTSYSFLADVAVVVGQQVDQGRELGTAGELLHFGARRGDAYFDPASLFGGGEVELVPFEVPPGGSPDEEVEALLQIADRGGIGLPSIGDVGGWLRRRAELGYHYVTGVANRPLDMALDLGERLLFPGPCSRDPSPVAPVRGQDRVAVTVAGLGSSSTSGSIDDLRTRELGYPADQVVRFSYAGGKVVGTGEGVAVAGSTYESAHTQGDLTEAGGRLADLVEDVLAAEPTAMVDLLAHSQGGVVSRLALLELEARGADLDRIGVVVTLGAPHRGADLATAVQVARTNSSASLGLDAAEAVLDTGLDPDAPAAAQLAETSDVVARLDREGVPAGVELVSIAARGDVVVAAPNTEVAGATNVTVPVGGLQAHGDLVGSDAATGEVARALAGSPPACESVGDAALDVVTGHGISTTEDLAGALLLVPVP